MKNMIRGSVALMVAVATVLVTSCGQCPNPPAPTAGSNCTPDVPVYAGLFTSPPTDISNVGAVEPLGHLNPGGGHTLPADHMYIDYAYPGSGTHSVPAYAMAPGKLMLILRQQKTGKTYYEYNVNIRYTCSVYSYYDHLQSLSSRINDYLTANNVQWRDLGGNGTGPWIALLGQKNGPAMLPVAAGEEVGASTDYGSSWDVGVVDTRWVVGQFATADTPYFPPNDDILKMFKALSDVDPSVYNMGNQNRNAACFIDYMDDSKGMRTAWFNKLQGTPKSCGTDGWYVPGKLQGDWFNPAMKALLPTLESDVAALTIVPDSVNPLKQVDFGIGNAKNGITVPSLAALDPTTWSPPVSGTQIADALTVLFDSTPGATINPDPATVDAGVTVCYDLAYYGGYYSMLLHMNDTTHLEIKFDPTPQTSPQCATLMAASPTVDSTWIEYVR